MSSGEADINGLKTNSIDISNSYGNITCKNIIAEESDFELSSGNLDISDADLQKADINNSYGNVTLSLLGTESDYSLDLSTSYGRIKVGTKSYEESLNVDNGGTRDISARLSSGDIKIRFK
jgi:DUF4097 and DUF4098 domain-containing protein YvlB